MKSNKYGLTLAAKEHIASGEPITGLEAFILFGVSNLPDLIMQLRRQGWVIKAKRVPYAAAVRRVNKHAVFKPPSNLPVRSIELTEYWASQ